MRKLRDVLADRNRPDPRDLRSRSDARRERKNDEDRLASLARRLVDLSAAVTARLELPEPLVDVLQDARRIRSPAAMNRQLRLVRAHLRELDAEAIAERLTRLDLVPVALTTDSAADAWVSRLVAGGDAALDDLLASHPTVDRRRVRQLVRALSGDRADAVARARRGLVAVLGGAERPRAARTRGR